MKNPTGVVEEQKEVRVVCWELRVFVLVLVVLDICFLVFEVLPFWKSHNGERGGSKETPAFVGVSWWGGHPLLTVKGQQRQDKAPPQVSLSTDVLGTQPYQRFPLWLLDFFFFLCRGKNLLSLWFWMNFN